MSNVKQVYKLTQRFYRLCYRADAARGTCMNLCWLHWSGLIFETLNELEALGVDVEQLEDPTFKGAA